MVKIKKIKKKVNKEYINFKLNKMEKEFLKGGLYTHLGIFMLLRY